MNAIIITTGSESKAYIFSDENKLSEFTKVAINTVLPAWKDFSKSDDSLLMKEALESGDVDICIEFFNSLAAKRDFPMNFKMIPAFIAFDS